MLRKSQKKMIINDLIMFLSMIMLAIFAIIYQIYIR